jgi:hypothetical protein
MKALWCTLKIPEPRDTSQADKKLRAGRFAEMGVHDLVA